MSYLVGEWLRHCSQLCPFPFLIFLCLALPYPSPLPIIKHDLMDRLNPDCLEATDWLMTRPVLPPAGANFKPQSVGGLVGSGDNQKQERGREPGQSGEGSGN